MNHVPFAILFDMDGTLLQTEKLAVPAFQQTFEWLQQNGLWEKEIPGPDQLTNVLGMTLEKLWETLLPGTSQETKEMADRIMLEKELELLKEGVTDLYPGVRETLTELKQRGIQLFTASNGLEKYIDAVCDHFELKPLFTDLYSAGRFQTKSKVDLVAMVIRDYNIQQTVMVGDRHSDVEAGKMNGLFTIGCDFGFAKPGELDGADIIVRKFSQITQVLPTTFFEQT
ncbi:MAG: HAD-IA family hydrolase [Clostridia bacterium]